MQLLRSHSFAAGFVIVGVLFLAFVLVLPARYETRDDLSIAMHLSGATGFPAGHDATS